MKIVKIGFNHEKQFHKPGEKIDDSIAKLYPDFVKEVFVPVVDKPGQKEQAQEKPKKTSKKSFFKK